MNDDRMNIPTIPICPPKKDTIIIRPTGCSNNKNYIAWNDIKNKPFQNIDKTFFSVDTSGNITLSKDLNNNINYLNIIVNEIKADSNIQPDWNQNDETKKDYIKNRPGGYYDEITTTTLDITATKQDESDKLTDVQVIEDNFRYQNNIDVEIYDSLGVDYRRTLTQRHIPEYVINEFGAEIYGNAHLVDASQPDTGEDLAIFKEDESNSNYSIGWHVWATSIPSGNLSLSVIKTEQGPIPFPSQFIPWEASPTANSVLYTEQSLTEEQQAQARANIGAGTPYTLPQASSDAIGGVKADSAEAADTQPVRIGTDGKLYTTPGITDISTKMDANNPVGTGSFSMNRKADTLVGRNSHAEGQNTTASGSCSHAEGSSTTASGGGSHAEGQNTTASGSYSHAEGSSTTASVKSSHAEGQNTTASGGGSHAEGSSTTASGSYSHAEGVKTTASGQYSHAEGGGTTAKGQCSHAEGYYTTAKGKYSHAQGKYNIEDTSNTYADIIGNGTSDTARSNAATVDWSGNAWFAGNVYTGSTSGTNKDDGSKKLATEEYVNSSIATTSVLYTAQSLTEEQKVQARQNIGAQDLYNGLTPVSYSCTNGTNSVSGIVYLESGNITSPTDNVSDDIYWAFYFLNSFGSYKTIDAAISSFRADKILFEAGYFETGTKWYANINKNDWKSVYITDSTIQFSQYINGQSLTIVYDRTTDTITDASTSMFTPLKYDKNNTIQQNLSMKSDPTEPMQIATKQYVDNAPIKQASATELGGVKADSAEAADTQPVHIGVDGKLYTAAGGTDVSLGLTSAAVGQIIKVKAIDESGKPTAWEAAEMASGDKEWIKICDVRLTEEDTPVAAFSVTALPDGTPLEGLGLKEIRFAGGMQIAASSSYSYGTFFVNDKSIIIGQNFPVNTNDKAWFRGRFEFLTDGYAQAEWSNSPSTTAETRGGGVIINPHYYGANLPDIADIYTDTEIKSIKITAPKSKENVAENMKALRLVVVGR